MRVATLLDGLTGDGIASVELSADEPIKAAVDGLARRFGYSSIEAACEADQRWRRVGAICGGEVYKDPEFVCSSEETPPAVPVPGKRRRSASRSRRWHP